jgi:hypothetical protein
VPGVELVAPDEEAMLACDGLQQQPVLHVKDLMAVLL